MKYSFEVEGRVVDVEPVDMEEDGDVVYGISFSTTTDFYGRLSLTPGFLNEEVRDQNLARIAKDTETQRRVAASLERIEARFRE